jgi:hypothetical protein
MLSTIVFVIILLFIILLASQLSKAPTPKGFTWWIKLFVIYVALMIIAGLLWLLSFPVFVGLKRLPPFAIIIPIHNVFNQIMLWIMPIGITNAIVLYFIYLILRPIILAITLGIVDIAGYSPFREFIEMYIFEFVENLLKLNFPGMWRTSFKIMIKTPQYIREMFSSELRSLTELENRAEDVAREEKNARDQRVAECIQKNSIDITDLMTTTERKTAEAQNAKTKSECELAS